MIAGKRLIKTQWETLEAASREGGPSADKTQEKISSKKIVGKKTRRRIQVQQILPTH